MLRRKVLVHQALMCPPAVAEEGEVCPHISLAAHHRPTIGPVLALLSVYVCTVSSDPRHELLCPI